VRSRCLALDACAILVCAVCACLMWASAAPAQQSPPPAEGEASSSATAPDGSPTDARTAERWGAVAYTADGAFGAAYGIETKEDAERLAVDECRREATDKQDCERGVVTRRDSWFHIQFCKRGGDIYTHITTNRTLVETNQAAARFAKTSKYGLDGCRLIPNGLFHSGGLHTRI
jgi:hypothetical protein